MNPIDAAWRPLSRGEVRKACWPLCESVFATLECELLDRERFATPAAAHLAVFDYIEGWYNRRRRHSALDYRSPMAYEKPAPVQA
jgi:putative transposase